MTVVTVNYTDEMVARLHEVYDGSADEATRDAQIESLAAELDRKPASIRAKLTREGVYVAKAKVAKGVVITKADYVGMIAHKLGVAEEAVESLEKANKAVLARLAAAL